MSDSEAGFDLWDEIERLRDDMNAMAITNGKRLDEIERLREQLVKARGALRLILSASDDDDYRAATTAAEAALTDDQRE